MTAPSSPKLLSAHNLLHQVLELIERSRSYCVLVTPFLEPWINLEIVIRRAVARRVAVHLVTRSAHCAHNDIAKRDKAINAFKALRVKVHDVDWLHAKLYLSESEAIVTSLNLTASGKDNPNLGVHLLGEQPASEALILLDQWRPGLSHSVRISAPSTAPNNAAGFCIRCQRPRRLNLTKPFCCDCWETKKVEQHPTVESCCHRCGAPSGTSLREPQCVSCIAAAETSTLASVTFG